MQPSRMICCLAVAALLFPLAGVLVTAPCDAQELVSFPTDDGGVVYATLSGTGDHGIVLAHGGRFTKESWAQQAQVLVEHGFVTLALDFRGRGRSRGGPGAETDDDAAHLDVLAAMRFLRGRGLSRISLIGASFGGWACARASAMLAEGAIDRLILLAHSPIENPEQMQGRKLFLTTRDDFGGGDILRLPTIRDQYERAPKPKELVVLEGSAHAQHIFGTEQGPRLLAEIIRFMTDSEKEVIPNPRHEAAERRRSIGFLRVVGSMTTETPF